MRTLIYWVLAVSSLFLVSCSKDSNVLNDYHRDTVLENMVYRFGGTGDETIYDIIKVDDGIVIVGTTNSVEDRKSTRLNSSHVAISYAVFCLKKKKQSNP